MSNRSGFFEGMIIGALAAVAGLYFWCSKSNCCLKKADDAAESTEDVSRSPDDLIAKTKEAIEEGFEKVRDRLGRVSQDS